METAPPRARPSAITRRWARRAGLGLVLAVVLYWRCAPRPEFLPLATLVDGPSPAQAAGVLIFLHGYGGDNRRAARIATPLRQAGLPPDVSIVFIEAPFSTGLGHSWGFTRDEQAISRARIRALLRDLLAGSRAPRARVVVAGFSQGAGVAIDTAIEEPRIGAFASLSPCQSWLRGELPKHRDLRVLLAYGTHDTRCPIEESRSLARVLDEAHEPARYIEFDGGHTIPPEVVRALADLVMAP